MKRFLYLVLTIALVVTMLAGCSKPVVRGNENTTHYYIAELGISIEMPNDLIVFTRDVAEGDPNLELVGRTAEDILDEMETYDTYIMAFSKDLSCEFSLNVYVGEGSENYNKEKESTLVDAGKGWESDGTVDEYYSVYVHDQTKFICSGSWNNDSVIAYVEYYTEYNGNVVTLYALSYTDQPISSAQKAILEQMVHDTDLKAEK